MKYYPHPDSIKGFTLIELLVVLALMAGVSAIAVPKLWGQYDQFRARQQIEYFWQDLKGAVDELRATGDNVVIDPKAEEIQIIADKYDLTIQRGDVLLLRSDGFVKGGEITLEVLPSEQMWSIKVSTPDGRVRIERTSD